MGWGWAFKMSSGRQTLSFGGGQVGATLWAAAPCQSSTSKQEGRPPREKRGELGQGGRREESGQWWAPGPASWVRCHPWTVEGER